MKRQAPTDYTPERLEHLPSNALPFEVDQRLKHPSDDYLRRYRPDFSDAQLKIIQATKMELSYMGKGRKVWGIGFGGSTPYPRLLFSQDSTSLPINHKWYGKRCAVCCRRKLHDGYYCYKHYKKNKKRYGECLYEGSLQIRPRGLNHRTTLQMQIKAHKEAIRNGLRLIKSGRANM